MAYQTAGTKKSEFHFALDHIKKESHLINNEFMHSIANEVRNEMSYSNQLFFLVKMTVKDILQLNSLLKWHNETDKWGGYIIINKEATTGFYAHAIGSTSILGIKLETDVKLPVKFIDCIVPDIAFANSIYDITYDCDLWDDGKIVYCSLPKNFRLNMNNMGLTPIKKNVKMQENN
ncbi:MAG: hypothetical protein NC320_11260 [Clostridium sp.]|nr:hypothetical protein [Clostridium sp.]